MCEYVCVAELCSSANMGYTDGLSVLYRRIKEAVRSLQEQVDSLTQRVQK